MVQLTLVGSEGCDTLTEVVGAIAERWSATLGAGEHLTTASRATLRRFDEWGVRSLNKREQARIASYFGAVVRKATMRARGPAVAFARERLLAATIEADLLDAGWSTERVSAEVRRVLGEERGAVGAA